jgi:hypothetical protein
MTRPHRLKPVKPPPNVAALEVEGTAVAVVALSTMSDGVAPSMSREGQFSES